MRNQFVKIERRFTVTKALSDDGTFEGYASVFDIEDHGGDTVRKGAFKAGLQKLVKEKRTLKMLWNHDRYQPIGKFTEAEEDGKGLFVTGKLTLGVQKADETRLLMLDEAVDSMSIGGYVVKEQVDNKTFKRDLLEIELREISPVTFPALDAARIVSVKSLSEVGDLPELEAYLRDVGGFSAKDAKTIISKAKAATPRRDVGDAAAILKAAIRNLTNGVTP
jgi:HK97 family phage prohead protease